MGLQRQAIADHRKSADGAAPSARRRHLPKKSWVFIAFLLGLGCGAAGIQQILGRNWAAREREMDDREAKLSAAELRFAEESRKTKIELDACQADLDENRWTFRSWMTRNLGPNHSRPGRDQRGAAIVGTVEKYDPDEGRVTISRGKDDGVEVGAHFEITSRSAFVAEVVIKEVAASSSVAAIYFRVLAKHPAPGDIAIEVIPK